MNVLLTFDVEVWCDGWSDLERKFPQAFARYIYGRSSRGDCALPLTLRILADHGLRATFFVEPLFAYRFGVGPLREIVGLISAAGQDVQLHLHAEWTDEARPAILPNVTTKRPHLSHYSLEEQTVLIERAREMLSRAGAATLCAFRAGSYGCNRDTLAALHRNGLRFDSSVNPSRSWSAPDFLPTERGQRVAVLEGVTEYPITVFADRPGHLRQVQVGSSSLAEVKHLLDQAREHGRSAFVIVSHNFEMLVPGKSKPDPVVVRRFLGLCDFLERHREGFPVKVFPELKGEPDAEEPPRLTSSLLRTGLRTLEQVWRRVY